MQILQPIHVNERLACMVRFTERLVILIAEEEIAELRNLSVQTRHSLGALTRQTLTGFYGAHESSLCSRRLEAGGSIMTVQYQVHCPLCRQDFISTDQ